MTTLTIHCSAQNAPKNLDLKGFDLGSVSLCLTQRVVPSQFDCLSHVFGAKI